MSLNEPRPSPFTETVPAALPYLPPQSRPIGKPVPPNGNPVMIEQAAVASRQPRNAKTAGRPSLTRITIALFTLGLSIPFIGIRREHTTEYYK